MPISDFNILYRNFSHGEKQSRSNNKVSTPRSDNPLWLSIGIKLRKEDKRKLQMR